MKEAKWMEELPRDTAIRMAKTEWWKGKDAHYITRFQLFQERMCVSEFSIFHKAVEESLGSPVFTHQFGTMVGELQAAHLKITGKEMPTLEEFAEIIPND